MFVEGICELPRALCAPAMTWLTRSAGYGGTHGSRPATVHFCRAGPVCPAVSAGKIRVGPSRTPAPKKVYLVVRRGGALPLPRATARVAPTEGYKRCSGVKNPPVTAAPCQPPLGKGAWGRGMRIATAGVRTGFAMTVFLQGVSARPGGGVGAPRPTECNRKCGGAGRCGHRPLRKITRSAVVIGRDDVGSGPYGGKTEIHLLSGGRGRTPPLRRHTRGAGKESPSHGCAVPAPFRQGGYGDRGCGLPRAVCVPASQ